MSPCLMPLADETLTALWSGELGEAEADAAEAHIFACDACEARSRRLARLVEGLREVVPPVLSAAHLDRLRAAGKKLLVTDVQPGVDSAAFFARELDLLVHALHGDLAHAQTVDLEVLAGAREPMRFERVPFSRAAGLVFVACQRHFQTLYPDDTRFRVVASEPGGRRVIGEYFIAHTWA